MEKVARASGAESVFACEACGISETAWCVAGYYMCEACARGFLRGDIIVSGRTQEELARLREDLKLLIEPERACGTGAGE